MCAIVNTILLWPVGAAVSSVVQLSTLSSMPTEQQLIQVDYPAHMHVTLFVKTHICDEECRGLSTINVNQY